MAERVWSEKDLRPRATALSVLRHAEEVSGNVAATCRYYGISRNVFYRWKRRYEEEGLEGLRDRSSAPTTHRRSTHPRWSRRSSACASTTTSGRCKITMYLHRYHEVKISPSGVWRILTRLDMNRLPASQRYKRRDSGRGSATRSSARPPGADRREVHRAARPEGAQSATTSTPRSTTAPGCAGALRNDQKRGIYFDHCCPNCPSPSTRSRPTNGQSSAPGSTAPARQGHRPHPDQAPDTPAQRQGRELPPHRLRGVLPAPRGRGHRRRRTCSTQLQEWEDHYNYHRPHGALGAKPRTNDYDRKTQTHLSQATASHTSSGRGRLGYPG